MNGPTLLIFSGLPGSGKSSLAEAIATEMSAVFLRIDTIEQSLRERDLAVTEEGYSVAYHIAADNLRCGNTVVADSCNPIAATHRAWEQVAISLSVPFTNIEVSCSDQNEHRRRVETRKPTVPGLKLPTWSEVEDREFDPWTGVRITIDTSVLPLDQSVSKLLAALGEKEIKS